MKKTKEYMNMERKELSFMKKKGAPKKMIAHERAEIAKSKGMKCSGRSKKGR